MVGSTIEHSPRFEVFEQLAAAHDLTPVYRRLLSDTLTPVSAFHKLNNCPQTTCLFESVIGGEKVGRYSFLAIDPFEELVAHGREVTVTQWAPNSNRGLTAKNGTEEYTTHNYTADNPLEELRRRLNCVKAAHLPQLPPFTAGAVGYAGYDVVRYVERLPNPPLDDRKLPDLAFAFYDRMVVFDNVTKTIYVIAHARTGPDCDFRRTYQDACQRVDELVDKLAASHDAASHELRWFDIGGDRGGHGDGEAEISYHSNFPQHDFENAVRKCVEYIQAGDIFQVVISQRLELEIDCDPFDIYRTLRVINPSPFMFFLRTADVTLVGSSPEIMCRVVDGRATVRPLAGTRPRGATEEEDRKLAEELLADPKERAEHVMLVDLGRNDVGRVAQYGTVELSDVMAIERYSHVMHISSNVSADLAPGKDAFDALAASLPAGTVSGAPKVRAMEIIDELEPNRRGPYAGAVGYIDYSGNMDTCIALRTLVVQGTRAYVQAGAGIVADSQPHAEYKETLNKARGLIKAIETAQRKTRA